jgi:hypothetical protein
LKPSPDNFAGSKHPQYSWLKPCPAFPAPIK